MPALSATATHEYYVELGGGLPPPILPNEEYRKRRYTTAIEAFEDLCPGDAYEGRLAVLIVLCSAHAVEIMREAGEYRDDFAKLKCCRAQAASMMREGRAAKRILTQEQKVRRAVEAVAGTAPVQPAAAKPAAAAALLPEAVAQAAPPASVKAAPAQPALAAAVARPMAPAVAQPRPAATQAAPAQEQTGSALPPSADAIAKAEAFADRHIEAAAQILRDGGVTPQSRAQFRGVTLPSDPAVIDALVHGTSDMLTLLDEAGAEMLAAAD